jgi:hypothetical protein
MTGWISTELLIVAVTGGAIYHVYTDGRHYKQLMAYKKYWTIAGYGLACLAVYTLIKRYPAHAQGMTLHAADFVQYLPIQQKYRQVLAPILNFATPAPISSMVAANNGFASTVTTVATAARNVTTQRICKRSVSETKKKYVASLQGWTCGQCRRQLNAWFEVDHKKRLDQGGTNEVSNLVALCRECHGGKTAMENM